MFLNFLALAAKLPPEAYSGKQKCPSVFVTANGCDSVKGTLMQIKKYP